METLTQTLSIDLEALSAQYVRMLEESDIPDPLLERIAVAAVLADLFALAGMPLTPEVEAALARLQ